ncbi:MAG TPA: amidase family protein, partial [Casimicrobium huifangae]|nr:amidase family protein [Casimicrobium huifangae]
MTTIANLQQAFTAGTDQPSALASRQLKLALDPAGEGARVFLALSDEAIRAAATHADERFQPGGAAGPRALEGITISIKDLFDVAGEVTTAGSTVLRSRAPTTADAPAVARLRAAGAVLFGRTNMVEFAFSGVGINPHYGTPRNRWQREDAGGHVPGGSSSGAGVSVADGMCVAALGTDTGGSVRIPAA